MASKFKHNKAPGWGSSDEEESSEEGEATSSDEDNHNTPQKRTRADPQQPTGQIDNTGAKSAIKVNRIWSDVLVDQQLSGGLSHGANVMSGDTFVPRGSETYDCTKAKEATKTSEEPNDGSGESKADDVVDIDNGPDDNPFEDVHLEGPDMMAALVDKRKLPGNLGRDNRKRPWPRGGSNRRDEDHRGRGQWNGQRGRGRGGNWNRGGGRRRLEKISLSLEESPKEIGLAIGRSLGEVKTDLMTRSVECVGKEKAIALYNKTVEIENADGIMTLDGRRRRTSGGVFFYLLREDPEITEDQKNELFGQDREEYRKRLEAKRRFEKKSVEGETSTMEVNDGEKPLKDLKEVFLEEASTQPKFESENIADDEAPMDG